MWKMPVARKAIIFVALGALGILAALIPSAHALLQWLNEFISQNFATAAGGIEEIIVGWLYDTHAIEIAHR